MFPTPDDRKRKVGKDPALSAPYGKRAQFLIECYLSDQISPQQWHQHLISGTRTWRALISHTRLPIRSLRPSAGCPQDFPLSTRPANATTEWEIVWDAPWSSRLFL